MSTDIRSNRRNNINFSSEYSCFLFCAFISKYTFKLFLLSNVFMMTKFGDTFLFHHFRNYQHFHAKVSHPKRYDKNMFPKFRCHEHVASNNGNCSLSYVRIIMIILDWCSQLRLVNVYVNGLFIGKNDKRQIIEKT